MAIDFAHVARGYFERAHPDCRLTAQPVLAFLSSGFQITWFEGTNSPRIWYALLKPHTHVREQFGLTMEYFLIGNGYPQDFHQRTLLAEPQKDLAFRVDGRIRFIASPSPLMRPAAAAWAAERKIAVVPIDTKAAEQHQGTAHAREQLYQILQSALWRRDLFDDSEPVREPSDFFGRQQFLDEVLQRTFLGRPVAVLGLRKIGKSSVLRRLQDLLAEDPSSVIATAFLSCNATRIKSGRWWTLLNDVLTSWQQALSTAAAAIQVSFTPPDVKRLTRLISEGKVTNDPARVAEAFQRDFERLTPAAAYLVERKKAVRLTFVAFFDEADELYPHLPHANYWREDYFLFWNTLQAIKRGLANPSSLTYNLGAVNPAGIERGTLLDQANPLFELGQLYLSPMPVGEATQLLRGIGTRMGLEFDDGAVVKAHEITGGHPWLLRKLGSRIHTTYENRGAKMIVHATDVDHAFARSKRGFYSHVDWILNHLKRVAPDEYRLLKDIATGGDEKYLKDWADQDFREVFADHLSRYGLVVFRDNVPTVALTLLSETLKAPAASELPEQLQQLRELVDQIERSVRFRLSSDLTASRSADEAVEVIAESIPKEASGRPRSRDELKSLGRSAGVTAVVESLNWGDYLILSEKFHEEIVWSGPQVPKGDRVNSIRQAFETVHLVRHNNLTDLRGKLAVNGFDAVYAELFGILEMFGG